MERFFLQTLLQNLLSLRKPTQIDQNKGFEGVNLEDLISIHGGERGALLKGRFEIAYLEGGVNLRVGRKIRL